MSASNESKQTVRTYLEEYLEKVFYFSLKRTGSKQEAEDLSSDISLCIIAQLQKGCEPDNFPAWVWAVARNRYSRWADEKHRRVLYTDASDNIDAVPDEVSTEAVCVRNEELQLLRRELAFISSDYRDIVVAYYINDTPIREIARALSLAEGTVKTRLSRVRTMLKEGMNMAREFGTKSYNPEDISFSSGGHQPSGLPWSAVWRKIPKNILIQADNNPSTVEELAMELGVSVPYMEEEAAILEQATLLRKAGSKYITNFFIASAECQTEIVNALLARSSERSALIDAVADCAVSTVREAGDVPQGMTDGDIKWWLCIYITDMLIEKAFGKSLQELSNPGVRENGETWGFIGYERCEMAEDFSMGRNHNREGAASYKIRPYGLWDRAGEMTGEQTKLLKVLLQDGRKVDTLSEEEKTLWGEICGRFAHVDGDGRVLPDLLVFCGAGLEKVKAAIEAAPRYAEALAVFREHLTETEEILKKYSNEMLRKQLPFYEAIEIAKIRTMTVTDLVACGALTVPAEPDKSTVAMWLEM